MNKKEEGEGGREDIMEEGVLLLFGLLGLALTSSIYGDY